MHKNQKIGLKSNFGMHKNIFGMHIIRQFSSKIGLKGLFSSVLGLKMVKMNFGIHIIRKKYFFLLYIVVRQL